MAWLTAVEALSQVACYCRGAVLIAQLLDLLAIDFQSAIPQAGQILRADVQHVLNVHWIIGARRFDIETDDAFILRVLKHHAQRHVF